MRVRQMLTGLLFLELLLGPGGFGGQAPARADEKPVANALGKQVLNSSSLRDIHGNRRALRDIKGNKALVVAFVGTDCPISNLYLPELIALEKKYRDKGVQFLGVYPNEADDLDRIASHAYDRNSPFLVLKDIHQKLADACGVTRVPTVVVLDGNHVLSYRGRVDDRYGVAARRPKATRDDLARAIEEVLAGKNVSVPETEADGCLIDRTRQTRALPDITYNKHVVPILQARCQVCHRPEQAAPFSLLTYADAVKHGRMIKEVTGQRRMPPWHADARFGHFAGDRRLTDKEIDALAAWVDGGMPRGDAKDLPSPVEWVKGWTHGKPDLILEMPEEFAVPATGVLPYQNWIIDPKFTEDKWVQVAECRPGAPAVVHHIVAYILKEGQRGPVSADGKLSVLVGWAPGDLGLVLPPETALRLPKGARLRLELHYTPNGTALKDRSAVGITFAKKPPKYELYQSEFANMAIAVTANDPHFKAEATFRFPADARLISLAPHMHYRGKHYFYEAIYPDGKKETLLSVPRWDFNWQNVYRFKEPVKLPKGTKLHSVAHWDNSTNNPLNPAPDKTVRFGLQSWDEMMVGFVSYVWERQETAAELAKNPPKQSDLFFDRLDVNGDDVITADELPAQLKAFAPLAGIKVPERMTRPEFEKLFNEMRNRMPSRRPKQKPNTDSEKKLEPTSTRVVPRAVSAVTAAQAGQDTPPTDWIDPGTGHRVIRLSRDGGTATFYFHQGAFTEKGDKLVVSTKSGLATIDLTTLGVTPCQIEQIVKGGAKTPTVGGKSRQVFYAKGGSLYATHLDTKETREIAKLPTGLGGASGLAVNADETLLASTGNDPKARELAKDKADPRAGKERSMVLFTADIKTGDIKRIYHSVNWLNHTQFSPTDPNRILFCHEGKWDYVDRIWTIRADGTDLKKIHTRLMDHEIFGHEFFSGDGQSVWYDLQTPRSTNFWLAGVNLVTGERVRYRLLRDQWSVHYNQSPDGNLFAGDGGGPNSVANRTLDGSALKGPGNGQWIYLFTPKDTFETIKAGDDVVKVGAFDVEKLVEMKNHRYNLEPNVRFTPDNRWVIFRSNMHGPTHVYAVEVKKQT